MCEQKTITTPFNMGANTKQELLDFALAEGLKHLFLGHETGWLYAPDLPGLVIKEDWKHYDELLNWIEEKERQDAQ